MTDRIEIQIADERVRTALQQAAIVLQDLTPVMAGISAELLSQVEYAFAQEGPGWQKLKPSTIRRRTAEKKWPGKVLQVSNALARSYLPFHSRTEAGIGSNLTYAAIHHFGGKIQRKGKAGTARLRTDAKGNLLRQGAAGRLAKLSVFAKKSHKRAVERSYQGKDYTISMPARPALPVDAQRNLTPPALDAVLRVVQTALGNALMG